MITQNMYRPAVEVTISKYGFLREQNIFFFGSDSFKALMTLLNDNHKLPPYSLNEMIDHAFENDLPYYGITEGDYNVTMSIIDLAPNGRSILPIGGQS